uniref:Uncharacterized protein n=1 Tax=Panthera tigris altaica TaxID=74533 RepID=A0A8C9J8L0_PANTA
MLSRSMTNEAIAVLTPNGISFPQTGEPKPTNQRQYNLKKQLKAEVKVLGAIQILCGVLVLSLGIILVSVPSSPSFTPVFSTLLKAAYPFMGGLRTSWVEVGRRCQEGRLCICQLTVCREQGVNGRTCFPAFG